MNGSPGPNVRLNDRRRYLHLAPKFASLLILCLLALFPIGAEAAVIGLNDDLGALGGQIFIPLQPAASGTLNQPWPSNSTQRVGVDPDRIKLPGRQGTSGFVTFDLIFDLTGQFGEQMVIEPDSASLILLARDIDFRPVALSGATYAETLAMTFMRDDGTRSATTLTLNRDSYVGFRDDFDPTGQYQTNQFQATYTINLQDDLGVTSEDFDQMMEDLAFRLSVTLGAELDSTIAGGREYRNTQEMFANSFEFAQVAIPEPASAALLACGAVAMALRRRRR